MSDSRDTSAASSLALAETALEQVCLSHIHSMRIEDRVRRVETDFGARLREFVRLLDDALRDTVQYDDALSGAARLLDASGDDITAITEALSSRTNRSMRRQVGTEDPVAIGFTLAGIDKLQSSLRVGDIVMDFDIPMWRYNIR